MRTYAEIINKYLENKGLLTRQEEGQLFVRIELLEEQIEELKRQNRDLQSLLETYERFTG